MSDSFVVPGLKVAKLVCVSVGDKTNNSNKFYNLYQQDSITFLARWGRIDGHISQKIYSMKVWNSTIDKRVNRKENRYTDVTHLFSDDKSTKIDRFSSIKDLEIKLIIEKLQSYASNSVRDNYTVGSNVVTRNMLDEAQGKIDEIIENIDHSKKTGSINVSLINKKLIELFHVIPRKMKNVSFHICSLEAENPIEIFSKIMEDEQSTLDVMSGQVLLNAVEDKDDRNILEIMGLEMRTVKKEEIKLIKSLLGENSDQFVNAYAVKNTKTQLLFDSHIKHKKNKKHDLFWHGSRNQNWLNILSSGLLIRPSGVTHTGSMFGDGIYFANKARKSIGYTSLKGSYWAGGSSNVAFLALFSVHIGDQLHIQKHTSDCCSINKEKLVKNGFDSVFAHRGADLRNDEFIIYDSSQCTISFIVEISD
jgi:poly [ADP-ribose] polymerase